MLSFFLNSLFSLLNLGRQRRKTTRRNSDSALTTTSKEDEVTLVKLKQLEDKFKLQQERIEILEKEMEQLPKLFFEERSPKPETKTDEGKKRK